MSSILLATLIGLGIWVMRPFLVSVAWAAILSIATWPLYRRVRHLFERHPSAGALIMTAGLIVVLVLPVLWLVFRLQGELAEAYQTLSAHFSQRSITLPDAIAGIPVVGPKLHDFLAGKSLDPVFWKQQMTDWIEPTLRQLAQVMGKLGRTAMQLGATALTLFFFYRDGNALFRQFRQGLSEVVSGSADVYLGVLTETTHAVLNGLILTALVQGMVAGIGFWIVGVGVPVLLGAVTAIASLIPFVGTVLVWGPVAAWLVLSGQLASGLGLLAWGALAVHPTDNLLRPILISRETDIPLPIVLFGVIGGLFAFGMVGLFLGPMILTTILTVWRQWLSGDFGQKEKTKSDAAAS